VGVLGDIYDYGKQLFTTDFWGRIFTRPLEAVRKYPGVAAKSALVAGATVATGGLALKAAPIVAGLFKGLFAAGKAVAPAAGFAVKHPILSYVIASNAELPTEIVRAFASRPVVVQGGAPAPQPAPAPVRVPQPVPQQYSAPRLEPRRRSDFDAFFRWN